MRVIGLVTQVPSSIVEVSRAARARYWYGSENSSGPSPTPKWVAPRSSACLTRPTESILAHVPTQNSMTAPLAGDPVGAGPRTGWGCRGSGAGGGGGCGVGGRAERVASDRAGGGDREPGDPLADRFVEPGGELVGPGRREGGVGGDPGPDLVGGVAGLLDEPVVAPAVDVGNAAGGEGVQD